MFIDQGHGSRLRSYEGNTVVTREIKLLQPSSTSVRNNIISVHGNWPKIILKLFQRLTAAHEYFPTCSMSLK